MRTTKESLARQNLPQPHSLATSALTEPNRPDVPQKQWVLGSEIAARNRKSLAIFHRALKSQCSSLCLVRDTPAISGVGDGHCNRKMGSCRAGMAWKAAKSRIWGKKWKTKWKRGFSWTGAKKMAKNGFEGIFHFFSIFGPFCGLFPLSGWGLFSIWFSIFLPHFRLLAIFHAKPARYDLESKFATIAIGRRGCATYCNLWDDQQV